VASFRTSSYTCPTTVRPLALAVSGRLANLFGLSRPLRPADTKYDLPIRLALFYSINYISGTLSAPLIDQHSD
jgi:hypothetical protein